VLRCQGMHPLLNFLTSLPVWPIRSGSRRDAFSCRFLMKQKRSCKRLDSEDIQNQHFKSRGTST